MIEIKDKKECTGCTACMATCPKQCITMKEDEEGFLYPHVNKDVCNGCGACNKVCPVQSPILEEPFEQKAFLFQHKDEKILRESTSGGLFTALATWVIEHGGVVYGAAYDDGFVIRHVGIDSIEGLRRFRNSKYAQSVVGNSFVEVREQLRAGRRVLFSGTPCQLEGLHKFLHRDYDNLLKVDVVCHACPSPLVFRKYTDMVAGGDLKGIKDIRFRDKAYGYKYSVMAFVGNDGYIYKEGIDTDVMLRAFFNNISPRPSCFACPAKKRYRKTDFTIWDCFDVGKFSKELDNDKGVTRALVHSEKGRQIWEEIKAFGISEEIDANAAVEGVKEMVKSVEMNPRRADFFHDLNTMTADECFRKYFPVTMRHRAEKFVRLWSARLGLYKVLKGMFKMVNGGREIKR
ncbi:MAG: Coenzyme F420 hydrogenase/dehydrogenase, beta subunit C-terminal domain [Prevotella sp.]